MQSSRVVSLVSAVCLAAACQGSSSPPQGGDDDPATVDGGTIDGEVSTTDGAVVDAPGGGDGDGGASPDAAVASTEPCTQVFTIGVEGEAVYAPMVGIDGAGDAIALWRQGAYSQNHAIGAVHVGRFDDAVGWGPATEFVGGGGYPSTSLAVTPSGDAFAVWQAYIWDDDPTVWFARHASEEGWTAAAALPTDSKFVFHSSPDVALDANGDAIVVWGAANGLRAKGYAHDTGWGADAVLDPEPVYGARIAIGPGGVAIAIWNRYVEGQYQPWASTFSPDGGWQAPVSLGADLASNQLAFDGAGNAIATFHRYGEDGSQVWVARYDAITGWGTPVHLDAADTVSHVGKLAVAASGHAVVAWTENIATSMPRVALATYAPEAGWSDAMIQPAVVSASGPDVVVDAAGNALAAWHEFDGSETYVYARRFTPATGWGERFLLLEAPADHPILAMNAGGDVVLVWVTWDGNGSVLSACAID